MGVECSRFFVEGMTEKFILSRLDVNEGFVVVKYGKENVINEFKKIVKELKNKVAGTASASGLKEGNVCYLVDGDEEGAEGVYNRIKEELSGVEFSPPYIRFCVKGLCHVLIVVGDKDDGYKGCLESLLLQRLKVDEETSRLVDNFVSYKERRLGRLSRCERAKLRFYLTVLALSNDVGALYLDKNFVEELFKLVDRDFVRDVLSDFIEIKRERGGVDQP